MPTYDWDQGGNKDFPDLTVWDDPHGYVYRTVVCKINLIVNAEDVNELLEGTGYVVFDPTLVPPRPAVGEAKIEVNWNYRVFSQWQGYPSLNNETINEAIGNFSIGVLTFASFQRKVDRLKV